MKVLVVGGGAAGLMAAGAALRQGHEVTVLEHMEKPAQKILVTGKGRCNVTNDCTAEEFALLTAPEELELIQHIASYTDEIIGAAKDYDPVRITRYVIELATKFHKFYNACRVKGEEESLMQARLTLCRATATVIRNVLTMFNITVPTSM